MRILILLALHLFLLSYSIDTLVISQDVTIEPYCHFVITIIRPFIPSGATFQFNVSCQVFDTGPSSALITIYSDNYLSKDAKSKSYEIWNYEATTQTVNILLSSNSTVKLNKDILKISKKPVKSLFTAVLNDHVTDGYMLPFNLFNDKASQIFVVAHGGTPQIRNYPKQPYLSTYWTFIQNTITFIPWLPFFSDCSFESPNIMLNDLILPKDCTVGADGMVCADRKLQMNCIMEELQVINVDQQFWFNHKQNIIYYLFPHQLSLNDFLFYMSKGEYLDALIEEQYYNLVPMIYKRKSSDLITVNVFDIFFNVNFDSSNVFQIVTASMIGSYDASIAAPAARATVHVHYLSWWDNFYLYNQPFYYYISFALALSFVLFCIVYYLQRKLGVLQFQKKVKIFVIPAVKGLFYTLITAGSFIVMMYVISSQTNFGSIGAVFGGTLTGDALMLNNKGRDGLVLMFTGIFLLSASLQQAFKVSSSEELKIVLEDDKQLGEDEREQQAKIEFIKKNMYSHRRTMLLAFLVMAFTFLSVIFNLIFLQPFVVSIIQVLVFPVVAKVIVEIHRFFVIKDLLYISGQYVMMILTTIYYFSKNATLYQFIYLYLTKYVLMCFQNFYMQIFWQYLMLKIKKNEGNNCVARFFYSNMQGIIDGKCNQTKYERGLYYSAIVGNKMLGILMFPLVSLMLIMTEKSSQLPQILLIRQESLTLPLLMGFVLMPLQIYSLFFTIEVLKRYFGLHIEECIKFNHFKFKRRKFRWMNDEFAHSRGIHPFYRELQKFGFSSQFYFTVSMMATGFFTTVLGVMTIINNGYIFYNDPALLPIFLTIWISGQILSVLASVLAVKLKLYQKREEETMRQSLVKIEKYLKLNDTADYLQLQGVKEYFLHYNRAWIIYNFNKIFSREDLEQNNAELITKYKYYKSIFKKKQIEEKRRIREINQSHGTDRQEVALDRNRPIRFDQRGFNYLAKPMMYYWFYLAKQNIYLKGLVGCVRKEQIKSTCEYCNMDVELEALEKKQFYQLVNSYRLINVGRLFDERAFLEYYRLNQQYITICLECKDKNLHLETKINTKSTAAKIVLRWLLHARSRLLHSKTN